MKMYDFKNIRIVKEANIYFEGKVISYSLFFKDGSRKTLGVMQIGDYVFNTQEKEIIEITSGLIKVLLPNESIWNNLKSGMAFEVPANSSFKLKVSQITNYCCSYIEE